MGRRKATINERVIRTVHGLVMTGQAKPTPYRDGQNVIRDNRTASIVYLPPEAKDVPVLMRELVAWNTEALTQQELPIPIVAALAHYQFATIHPYFDGNGRTARSPP
ncbi:Fic family protein [Fimbriiglobus ruber]|uniref:Filamentation induced by cAMP protein Fic n=1 Tax=Fimbriiglobus ruber TaxID=1908690 RepID=A0A225E6B7_9BACT|nr:Fic family protein [Fimbriiglobus ruber]OWK45039.1 filamentation induced by cAMP protein Fic [Fimbriiglobus ruber]